MKINYKIQMVKEIERIKSLDKKPTLLLHACCAPCSSAVLEKLSDIFKISLIFYNPNISPESEFIARFEELKRLLFEMGLEDIKIYLDDYNDLEFYDIAKGMEDMPEGLLRCKNCYRLRLLRTAQIAKENNFDYFCTTLSISPYKNAQYLNEIGTELEEKFGVKYLVSDFKKDDGYKRSIELSKKYNLYRQNYCGCIYSKQLKENETTKTE